MNTKNEIHGLTTFRFIAAFYVFIFHCNLRFKVDAPEIVSNFIHNGAIGMTFFFVLSGFVMSWSSRDGIKDNYLRSRLARIYAAYLFMGLVSLPFILDYNAINIPVYIGVFLTMPQSFLPEHSLFGILVVHGQFQLKCFSISLSHCCFLL